MHSIFPCRDLVCKQRSGSSSFINSDFLEPQPAARPFLHDSATGTPGITFDAFAEELPKDHQSKARSRSLFAHAPPDSSSGKVVALAGDESVHQQSVAERKMLAEIPKRREWPAMEIGSVILFRSGSRRFIKASNLRTRRRIWIDANSRARPAHVSVDHGEFGVRPEQSKDWCKSRLPQLFPATS